MRHDCIEPPGLTITGAADILGVTRQTLNNLVNGKSGISADMAIRLDKAFGGGAETWLRLQMAYDLAQAPPIIGAKCKNYRKRTALTTTAGRAINNV